MKNRDRFTWGTELCYWGLVAVVSLTVIGLCLLIADITGHRGF